MIWIRKLLRSEWIGLAAIFVAGSLVAGVMLLNFWDKNGDERRTAVSHWRSNLALIGGLLALAVPP